MTTVVCALFDGGHRVPNYSRIYSPEWVDKLYRGIRRNSTVDFGFLCLTDRDYGFEEPVTQVRLQSPGDWMCLNEIFRPDLRIANGLFMGLDTIITGNIDHILSWRGRFGVTRSPLVPSDIANPIVIFNRRWADILWSRWASRKPHWSRVCSAGLGNAQNGYPSELVFLKKNRDATWTLLDDLWPGHIVSYKSHYSRDPSLCLDARIVYFHGDPKPPYIPESWLLDRWS